MVKGFTAQLMNRVTPMPRQCLPTADSAPKSTFISIGTIINQISPATGRLTWATSSPPRTANAGANSRPSTTPAPIHSTTHRVR